MNKNLLHQSANAWVEQAKQDIANRIREFLTHSGISLPQMANDLGLDINELNNIMRGGAPSLETFAVLMIAAGLVMEIKSVEEVDMDMENGMPIPHGAMPMGMPMPGRPCDRHQPMPEPEGIFGDFHRRPMPEPVHRPAQQPRAANGQFRPWPKNQAPEIPTPFGAQGGHGMPGQGGLGGGQRSQRPNFASMNREQLVKIVREHLWDSEIDLANVGHDQLVRFLENKDAQFEALRSEQNGNRGVAIDPSVVQLKDKLKKTIDKNPHLREYLKDIFEQ